MAKLHDVAEAAGVSATLASFVMNGRAEEMRIAPATVKKVMAAAKDLSYIPNMAAKRLITAEKTPAVPEIVFLWPPTLHPTLLGNFMLIAQNLNKERQVPEMNLTIQPLDPDHAPKLSSAYLDGNFNGAIVSPMLDADVKFAEQLCTQIPMVALHARVEKHPNIVVDHYIAGALPVQIFARHGHRRVMSVCPQFIGATSQMNRQKLGFADACRESGLEFQHLAVPDRALVSTAQRARYGGELAAELSQSGKMPEAIYLQDDVIAMGFISMLRTLNFRIPQDLEVMTYGGNDISDASSPTISTVDYPAVAVTRAALTMVNELLYDPFLRPERMYIQPTVTYRESCPE